VGRVPAQFIRELTEDEQDELKAEADDRLPPVLAAPGGGAATRHGLEGRGGTQVCARARVCVCVCVCDVCCVCWGGGVMMMTGEPEQLQAGQGRANRAGVGLL